MAAATPPTSSTSGSTPGPTTGPHSGGDLNRRLRRLGVRGRRMRRGWTRERVIEVAQTLAWTIPLTLLLWVWAQDQQIEEQAVPNVRVRLDHVDPQMAVTRLSRDGTAADSTGNRPISATLVLRGPRAGLTEVLRPIREQGGDGLEIDLSLGASERTSVELAQELSDLPRFREAGVTVVGASPSTVDVRVERLGEVPANIVPGGDLRASEIVGAPTFAPSRVLIRGPSSVLDVLRELAGEDGPTVVAQIPNRVGEGEQQLDVPVELPADLKQRLVDRIGAVEAARIWLEPTKVEVRFSRRARTLEQYEVPTVVIWVDKLARMEGEYNVRFPELDLPLLNRVRVEGPEETIARLKPGGDLAQSVRARLQLEADDRTRANMPIRRQLKIELPPDVSLVGEEPTVTFELVPAE